MSIDQLKRDLATFSEDGVGAEFYFILDRGGNVTIKSADIDVDAQTKLKGQFTLHIKETLVENEDLSLLNLSAADERRNAIYRYDLDEVPADLNVLENILNNQAVPNFSFQNDSMSDIKGILIRRRSRPSKVTVFRLSHGC